MDGVQRFARIAAGLLAVVAVCAPTTATAQKDKGRNPVFVVVTFKSSAEAQLGIDIAEELRQRMIDEFGTRKMLRPGQVRVVTREDISRFLTSYGYSPDSVVSATDLRELGRVLGADETVAGSIARTAAGLEVKAHFYSLNNIGAPEVLPTVTGKDMGAVADRLADAYIKARKELPDYQKCRVGLINGHVDEAIVAARVSLTQYDKGVLPRACLMTAQFQQFQAKKSPIDSVIRVAQDILAIDSENELAIGQLADAYMVSGDTAKAIQMNIRLYRMNPTNFSPANSAIDGLVKTGSPQEAIPIAKEVVANNPGDVAALETYWKVLQAAHQWKQAIAAGEDLVKMDSSKADTSYFNRQIAAAYSDSQPAAILAYLGKATAKFPNNTHYWLGYSQELRRQGQLPQALDAAKKALIVDPKIDGGYATVLSLYAVVGPSDSAMGFARAAIAAGVPKSVVGGALLPLIGPALATAQKTSARSDWEEVYRVSATVDSLAPTPHTAFYMSFAAFNIGSQALTGIAELSKTDKPKACAENKVAAEMFLVMDLNMSRGASVDKETAAKLLTALAQYKPYIDQYKKTIPCK